jgi:hypothetical protein
VIVVSNTSPIMNLALVGHGDLLVRLFGTVFVPDAVWEELAAIGADPRAANLNPPLPGVALRSLKDRALVNALVREVDPGEAEAIALAVEMRADLMLLDDRLARRAALRLGLRVGGLLGLLVDAKGKGILPEVRPVLDELIAKAGFWVGSSLYARVLSEAGE